MATTTAHIEVLSAEVRVLQVGSRQVTLSVYRQLDPVPPEEIEPFGRVAIDSDKLAWHQSLGRKPVCVVGRDSNGTLVRSARSSPVTEGYLRREAQQHREAAERLTEKIIDYQDRHGVNRPDDPDDAWWRVEIRRWVAEREACLEEEEESLEWIPKVLALAAAYETWCALPLIVLAGLR